LFCEGKGSFSTGCYSLNNPYKYLDKNGLTPEDRANWALSQLKNNSNTWAAGRRWLPKDYWYWKCNEFIYAAHAQGDPDVVGYPTLMGTNQKYWKPTVSDYANPSFMRDRLDYIDNIDQVEKGDIVIWYDNKNNDHHAAIAINKKEVVYASKKGVKKNKISNMFPKTKPIIRRFKYNILK
jgi:hypothetical protein